MDKFLEMRAFVTVVDSGSFVRAAEALNLSKTAVSRLVGELEARLGTRLLHRTTRKLSLTPEGELFHERSKSLLDGVDEAEAELTAHAGEAIGELRVNVPVSFGLLHLAPLWPAFMALHPKVVLDVTLSDRLVDLVDEGYDLAVRIARLQTSSLVSRALTATRMMRVARVPAPARRTGAPVGTLTTCGDRLHAAVDGRAVGVRRTARRGQRQGDTAHAHQQRGHLLRRGRAAPGHRAAALVPRRIAPGLGRLGRDPAAVPVDRTRHLRGVPDTQAPDTEGACAHRLPRRGVSHAGVAGLTPKQSINELGSARHRDIGALQGSHLSQDAVSSADQRLIDHRTFVARDRCFRAPPERGQEKR
jgi:DNA-binding transcriptional LysR family regulator